MRSTRIYGAMGLMLMHLGFPTCIYGLLNVCAAAATNYDVTGVSGGSEEGALVVDGTLFALRTCSFDNCPWFTILIVRILRP